MIIIKIFVPLLFIVLNSCKGAEVGRFYAFNHPPFDDNDNIPVAVEHKHEVRKSKSITFSDEPTTFHPRFKSLADEGVTAEITTVSSDIYKDAPTLFRLISGDYSEGQIPVNVVYDKPEAVNSNERRRLVQQRRKPIDDKEFRTAGERKLMYQTIRGNKLDDEGVKGTVQENTSPVVRKTEENLKTKIVIENYDQNQGIGPSDVSTIEPKNIVKEVKLDSLSTHKAEKKADDKFYTRRGSINKSKKNQSITSSVVSTSGQTMKHENTSQEVNLLSHGLIKSDTDDTYNIRNYKEGVKNAAQAISGNTRIFIDRGTEFQPSSRNSSGYGVNQMTKKGTTAKDENRTKVLNHDAVEKQSRHAKIPSRGKQQFVPILESESYVYGHNGDFHYSYEGADGTKAFERGELKYGTNQNSDEKQMGEAVSGGFSYTDADGKDYSLTYTADENGYRPMGAHLPTPPPIPPAIARALAYLATKPTPIDEEPTKSWW